MRVRRCTCILARLGCITGWPPTRDHHRVKRPLPRLPWLRIALPLALPGCRFSVLKRLSVLVADRALRVRVANSRRINQRRHRVGKIIDWTLRANLHMLPGRIRHQLRKVMNKKAVEAAWVEFNRAWDNVHALAVATETEEIQTHGLLFCQRPIECLIS
jgi:hypothetical protein